MSEDGGDRLTLDFTDDELSRNHGFTSTQRDSLTEDSCDKEVVDPSVQESVTIDHAGANVGFGDSEVELLQDCTDDELPRNHGFTSTQRDSSTEDNCDKEVVDPSVQESVTIDHAGANVSFGDSEVSEIEVGDQSILLLQDCTDDELSRNHGFTSTQRDSSTEDSFDKEMDPSVQESVTIDHAEANVGFGDSEVSESDIADPDLITFIVENSNFAASDSQRGSLPITSNSNQSSQRVTSLRRNVTSVIRLKKRKITREMAKLPMLACKDEFIRRLRSEKVLVVTAETGSGKTTQLPQYCAEEFPGLVICTQPRVIAAISVARRIASEFDGGKVGINVGYEARNGNKVSGKQIMIMTDAALIRLAQHDRLLERVGVLMIDEAHERSLNTDIVVGIAKTVIRQRPDDFKVVIASATIDPKPFLDFFFGEQGDLGSPPPLTVPGRVFPISTVNVAFGKSEDLGTALAKVVDKTLKKHTLGHCLVFLQGAREVDTAITCFQRLAHPSWRALPLCGTLSPEEQNKVLTFDDRGGTLRMVVFCTNVAETSLTVPNVRIVIDTGLAKESRYDPGRRMTILEEVYISRSSAEQRKGRAGRTAEGHCVRLFAQETLSRENIEPEILRSSLDLVILQVCSLGFDPLEFNFLTRPGEASMLRSLRLLTEMECLTSAFKLTERGRLFNNLPFDPRLSNFVLMAHEKFKQGPAAATIAAIVSAPGSILFHGNSKDDRRTPNSTGLSSDLLLLRSIYKGWLNSGQFDRYFKCCVCQKPVPESDAGCRSCRVRYANANSLNNKVLDSVRMTIRQVQKEIDQRDLGGAQDLSFPHQNNIERIIGFCLVQSFPEQVCELIMPTNPTIGLYALTSDLKGQLSYSSALRVALPGAKYVVAMSQTRLPSGLVLMDKAHHIDLEWMSPDARRRVEELSLNTMECYKKENVSGRYCSCCRNYFRKNFADQEGYARFVVSQYDVVTTTLSVFAPWVNRAEVKGQCDALVQSAIEEDLAHEVVVDAFYGIATLAVAAGFKVKKVELVQEQPCRVHFVNPPVRSRNALLNWACKISGCTAEDIKWYSLLASHDDNGQHGSSAMAIVVFRQEEFAKMAELYSTDTQVSFEHGSYRTLVKSFNENIPGLLYDHSVFPVKLLKIKSLRCQIQISNLPEAIDERRLKALLRRNGLPEPNYFKDTDPVNGSRNVIISFNVKNVKVDIISKCRIIPELSLRCREKFLPAESIAFFQKCQEADDLCRLVANDFNTDGTAVDIVKHPDVFLLEEHLNNIESVHDVIFKLGRLLSKGQEVIFSGNLTSKCEDAVKALKKIIEPIKYYFGTRDKLLMGNELLANSKLHLWAEEYSLFVEEIFNAENFTGICIYGEKYEQGQFMASLADYYNEFANRYHLLVLSPTGNCLFRKGNPGEAELKKLIDTRNSKEVQISYQGFLSSVEIVVKPGTLRTPSVIIQECVAAIENLLKKFNQKSSTAKNCVYCDVHPGRTFLICGHPYCKECLQQATMTQLSNFTISTYLTAVEAREMETKFRGLVGSCPLCKTPISTKDLRYNLTRSTMEKVCMAFAQLKLRREDHPMGVCPMPKCGAFMPKQSGYSNCPSCKQLVCSKCGVGIDNRHEGSTCDEYQQLLKKGTGIALLRSIISSAEKYARAHWQSSNVRMNIVRIEENPGLKQGCMALQRYCSGIQRIGFNDLERNSVFGWHGTTNTAIPSICNGGFDPNRRSGQLHGPGEYFAVNANTSLGYSKGCQRLIVAQLVKCQAVTEVPTFCYVVNNPKDWSYSFNLPLLVVTCDSISQSPISWILTEKRLLPYPFEEPQPSEDFLAHTSGFGRGSYGRAKLATLQQMDYTAARTSRFDIYRYVQPTPTTPKRPEDKSACISRLDSYAYVQPTPTTPQRPEDNSACTSRFPSYAHVQPTPTTPKRPEDNSACISRFNIYAHVQPTPTTPQRPKDSSACTSRFGSYAHVQPTPTTPKRPEDSSACISRFNSYAHVQPRPTTPQRPEDTSAHSSRVERGNYGRATPATPQRPEDASVRSSRCGSDNYVPPTQATLLFDSYHFSPPINPQTHSYRGSFSNHIGSTTLLSVQNAPKKKKKKNCTIL